MHVCRPATWMYEVREAGGYVYAKRTSRPYETVDEIHRSFEWLLNELGKHMDPDRGILFDFREGPAPRTDPEFVRATAPYRESLFIGYGRGAVLVRSVEGAEQLEENSREDNDVYAVFSDEAAAVEHVKAPERPKFV